MFDGGVPEQFQQFIATRTSLPLHLSFPLHSASATATSPSTPNTNFQSLFADSYNSHAHPSRHHHQHHLPLQPNLLHQPSPTRKDEDKQDNCTMNFGDVERERQLADELIDNSWTNDEVLALLRIRSSMETWFPDITWENVSRKLAELGFKRTAEKCKEKFEEESRCFNNINYSKSYRFLSELEELYHGDHHHQNAEVEIGTEKTQQMEKPTEVDRGQDKNNMGHPTLEDDSRNDPSVGKHNIDHESEKVSLEKSKDRKRKRQDKFEMFKGFCENIVNKMMAQQEEMHNKLLQDMLKRDEDKFAREEAWKKREMDRMNKELELMAQEQAIAGDRQATIIEFLKKFAASSPTANQNENAKNLKVTNTSNPTTPVSSNSRHLHPQNPSRKNDLGSPPSSTMIDPNDQNTCTFPTQKNSALPITCSTAENPSSSLAPETTEVASSSTSTPAAPQNNNSLVTTTASVSAYSASSNIMHMSSGEKEDVRRRWPRDEVLALINLRCSLNNNDEDNKDVGSKAPLWERISRGMLELGYKRSAKRCKEKWENINKYFRKTKDNVNKKRSLDSRTCPYFHQLSTLYSQGKLASQQESLDQNHHLNPPPTSHRQVPQETQAQSSRQVGSSCFSTMHVDGSEKTLMQEG
ncbi:hypothetical protein L6164_035141 [Bauhinia variegata]|uniref:Uncharacterized protein n=1 Tax=Bauhinia variegata TaxID=167791 RepID=A0ACB9KX90_BAUVA|nr:hypothetical protein L6164_035141 [Bauhinia variegata]